jgi:hypothetical protein
MGGAALATTPVQGQIDREFLPQTAPYPVYRTPERSHYNLKWGQLTGRLTAGVQTEFNDNVNLSDANPIADLSIGPRIGIGFLYPISKEHVFQLDMGAGYRWYLRNPSASSINILPNSALSHTAYIGDVKLNFHDYVSAVSNPIEFGPLGARSGNLIDFNRLINTVGLNADWQVNKDTAVHGGYDYTIDRSLSSQFLSLDRDDHSFYAGIDRRITPRTTVGWFGTYTISDYRASVQNDGWTFGTGPVWSHKLSQFVTLHASLGYTISGLGDRGTIGDTSTFEGLTFQFGGRHTINRRTSHDLRFARHVGLGFGSNFTDTFAAQYHLRTEISPRTTLNSTFSFEHLEASGIGGESANRFLFSLSSGWRLTQDWSTAASYTFGLKESNLGGGDYLQNRLTLDISYHF